MVWFWTVLGAVLLLFALWRLYGCLRLFSFRPTTAKILRCEPLVVQSEADEELELFPVIEFTYDVDGREHRMTKQLRPRLGWLGAGLQDDAEERFAVGAKVPAWFDPRYPSQVEFERAIDWVGLVIMFLGLALLLSLPRHFDIHEQFILLILLTVALIFLVLLNIDEVIRDQLELLYCSDLEFEDVSEDDRKALDQRFFDEQSSELLKLGFTRVAEVSSRGFARFGSRNASAIYLSADRLTMASVGEWWYAKRFAGVFPLPFLRQCGVDFDSRFTNDTTLTTSQQAHNESVRPPGCRKLSVPPGTSLDDMFRMHERELNRIQSEDRLHPEGFPGREACLEYFHIVMAKLLAASRPLGN